MNSIIYLSQSHSKFSEEELVKLYTQSENHNRALGITGYLFYKDNAFVQYIEGPNLGLDNLIQVITEDNRHEITQRFDQEIAEPMFPNWHMKYLFDGGGYPFDPGVVYREQLS